MTNKTFIILIPVGYILALAGGVLGIPVSLLLMKVKGSPHGKMILATSLITLLFFLLIRIPFVQEYGSVIFFFYILLSALAGGFLATRKRDYFARGFCISLFSGAFGVAAILVSDISRAKEHSNMLEAPDATILRLQKQDRHHWPAMGWLSILLLFGMWLFLTFSARWLA